MRAEGGRLLPTLKKPTVNDDVWEPGATILVRRFWNDRVWEAAPVIVVEDAPDRLLFYLRSGTPAKATKIDHETGTFDGPFDYNWMGTDVLVILALTTVMLFGQCGRKAKRRS